MYLLQSYYHGMIYSSNMQYVHLFSALINQIEAIIIQSGYFIIFATTIFEGIPLLGMVIPGHVAILAGGFVSRLGSLNLYWVLSIALFGALVGDYIGFCIGKKYGMNFIKRLRPYMFISDSQLDKANNLLAKHTGKALIIGRFTPATRALMPFLAGSTLMNYGRFWFFNITGGIAWVVSSVMIGYIFGSAYHVVSGYIGKMIVFSIIISAIAIWGYNFINIRYHIFRRYELFTLILNIISILTFAIILEKLIDGSFKLSFDVWVNLVMQSLNDRYGLVSLFATIISSIGSVYVMAITGLTLSLYFVYKKKWRSCAVFFISTTMTAVLSGLLKTYFMSPRPVNSVVTLLDPSFPSSHASMATAVLFAIIYIFAPTIKSWIKRETMIVICVIGIIAIGISRLILNVHWFSDIIAGWSVGIFVATGSVILVKYISELLIKKKYV